MTVKYTWFTIPTAARDFTVKVYSKQTLDIKNKNGRMMQLHTDGQEPSEWIGSDYKGMNANLDETPQPAPAP